jgi:hypothetical protein
MPIESRTRKHLKTSSALSLALSAACPELCRRVEGLSKGWQLVLLAAVVVLAGCAIGTTVPATLRAEPLGLSLGTKPQDKAATPTATAMLSSTSTPQAMTTDASGRLMARRVASPPVIDGQVDSFWASTVPLQLPLTWGLDGTEHALDVELRALHTDEAVYFLAQWPSGPPSGEENTVFNKFTVHWRIPQLEASAQRLDCTVACHTAFANGEGRFVYANAETIPQGGSEALSAAGGWHAGTWTLEWSRPLVNTNPFDLQFVDLDQDYIFFVKVFQRVEGRPDPVSERHLLVFQP